MKQMIKTCFNCDSNQTYVHRRYEKWYKHEGKYYCKNCHLQLFETHSKQNKVWQKRYRDENREACNIRVSNWQKNNPNKHLQKQQRYIERHGFIPELLIAWSKAVRTRDNNTCQVCGKPSTEAHHIFHKSKYPSMVLILNNGIALCDDCHYEVHGKMLKRFA